MLKLYNSLTKNLEAIPKEQTVNLYSCGPTVYNYAHIGNLRSFICADVLYRTLVADEYKVTWVMNITDIDDKTIKATIAEYGLVATVKDLHTVTERYYQDFLTDLKKVGVSVDAIKFVRVTDVMDTITEFVKKLIDLGFAYRADDGSTYFSIQKYQEKFGDYGALMGEKFMEGKKINARIANDEYQKDDLSDFALWKAHTPDDAQIFWDDPVLGRGRPGWHIECSAVNWKMFDGKTTTIHTGGVDLRFPHHTNEIAQSTPRYAPEKFVEHWFHSEHLLVDGKKMSKSLGNFYTLRDLEEKGFDGLDFRYFVLGAHYRTQQNFTLNALQAAKLGLEGFFWEHDPKWLDQKNSRQQEADAGLIEAFLDIVADDLATPRALAKLHSVAKDSDLDIRSILWEFDKILGLSLKSESEKYRQKRRNNSQQLFDGHNEEIRTKRDQARAAKNWPESDRLRKELEELGYIVEDSKEGTKIHKK